MFPKFFLIQEYTWVQTQASCAKPAWHATVYGALS